MFNQIQVPRYSSIIRRLLRIVEDQPLPQLQGELQPTIVLENDRPEFAYLGETKLWATGDTITGASSNYGHFVFENPEGSGVIMVIEGMRIYTSGATKVDIGPLVLATIAPLALWTSAPCMNRDGRDTSTPRRRLYGKIHTAIYMTASNRAYQFRMNGTNQAIIRVPFVLKPGDYLGVVTESQNLDLIVAAHGYDRPMAPDET